MKILVAEDNKLFANTIELLIDELDYELIAIVDNATELLRLHTATSPDLLLLDIQLIGTRDGIDIATQITNSDNSVPIIFMTSFKDKETFDRAKVVNPFAFLVKPFDAVLLQRTIELAVYKYEQIKGVEAEFVSSEKGLIVEESIFIKVGNYLQKVLIEDITYIVVLIKQTQIHTNVAQVYDLRMSLKDIYAKLPISTFIQINRNTLINAVYITQIDLQENRLMVFNSWLPISRKYKEYVLSRLNTL